MKLSRYSSHINHIHFRILNFPVKYLFQGMQLGKL